MINVGHPEGQDDLERVLTATIRSQFPHVMRYPIEDTNTLLIASESPLSAARLRSARGRLPAELHPQLDDAVARLGPALKGGDVYTDDKAPVEWLIDTSIVKYAARGGQ